MAVSEDGDRYLELKPSDVVDCLDTHSKLCRFKVPIVKTDTIRSCAIALFKKDKAMQVDTCKTERSEWSGPKVVYLGERRWGISDLKEQTLTIACPGKESEFRMIPALGIFEIPLNCDARTSAWIFPASRQVERHMQLNHTSGPDLPPLLVFQEEVSVDKKFPIGVIPITYGNDSVLQLTKEVLASTNQSLKQTQFTRNELIELAKGPSQEYSYEHYPFCFKKKQE